MGRYLIGRMLQTVLSMLAVISIVFVLTRLSGNPVHLLLDANATERDQEILTRHLGLDQPLPVQYGLYVANISRGDFGNSILTRRPVTEHIWERLPATLELAAQRLRAIGARQGTDQQRLPTVFDARQTAEMAQQVGVVRA